MPLSHVLYTLYQIWVWHKTMPYKCHRSCIHYLCPLGESLLLGRQYFQMLQVENFANKTQFWEVALILFRNIFRSNHPPFETDFRTCSQTGLALINPPMTLHRPLCDPPQWHSRVPVIPPVQFQAGSHIGRTNVSRNKVPALSPVWSTHRGWRLLKIYFKPEMASRHKSKALFVGSPKMFQFTRNWIGFLHLLEAVQVYVFYFRFQSQLYF